MVKSIKAHKKDRDTDLTSSIKIDSNDQKLHSKSDSTMEKTKNNVRHSTRLTESAENVLVSLHKNEFNITNNNGFLLKKYSSNKVCSYDNLLKNANLKMKSETDQILVGEMDVNERIIYLDEEAKIKAALSKNFLFQDLNDDTM